MHLFVNYLILLRPRSARAQRRETRCCERRLIRLRRRDSIRRRPPASFCDSVSVVGWSSKDLVAMITLPIAVARTEAARMPASPGRGEMARSPDPQARGVPRPRRERSHQSQPRRPFARPEEESSPSPPLHGPSWLRLNWCVRRSSMRGLDGKQRLRRGTQERSHDRTGKQSGNNSE